MAQWFLLILNLDENYCRNYRPPCSTLTYAGSLLTAKGQRTLLMEQLSSTNNWLRFRGSGKLWNTYTWTTWVWEISGWGLGIRGNYGTRTHDLLGFEKLLVELWGFGKITLYKWTGWRWRLRKNHISQMSRLSLCNNWLGLRNYQLRLSNGLSLRSNGLMFRVHGKNTSTDDPTEFEK